MKSSFFEKYKHPKWQRMRLNVMQRDGFQCRDCGTKDDTLEVHHCHYTKGGEAPWDTEPDCLMTLCGGCHQLRADREQDIKLELGRLLGMTESDDLFRIINALKKMQEHGNVVVLGCGEYEEFANGVQDRLRNYACQHPVAREIYSAVTGEIPDWNRLTTTPKEEAAF